MLTSLDHTPKRDITGKMIWGLKGGGSKYTPVNVAARGNHFQPLGGSRASVFVPQALVVKIGGEGLEQAFLELVTPRSSLCPTPTPQEPRWETAAPSLSLSLKEKASDEITFSKDSAGFPNGPFFNFFMV